MRTVIAIWCLMLAAAGVNAQPQYDSHDAWKIRGKAVSPTAPTNGQTLVYNSTTKKWEPGAGGGATAGTGITVVGSTVSADTAVMQSRATEQAGTSTYLRSTTGNDTYTGSLTPTLTAYTTGGCVVLNPDTANTGAATLNVDALGAKSILGPFGSALADGDIPANQPSLICYNGTAFIKQGFSYLVQDPTAVTGNTKFVVKAGAGQSTNLQEWQDSAGSVNARITSGGYSQTPGAIFGGGAGYASIGFYSAPFALGSNILVAWTNTSGDSSATQDAAIGRNAAGLTESNSGTLGTLRDHKVRMLVTTHGADIASAGTIAPTDAVVRVSGTTAIATITVPTNCAVANTACQITLIPTGLWTTTTAGNIALASTAVVSKALVMTWHNTGAKWYPSY